MLGVGSQRSNNSNSFGSSLSAWSLSGRLRVVALLLVALALLSLFVSQLNTPVGSRGGAGVGVGLNQECIKQQPSTVVDCPRCPSPAPVATHHPQSSSFIACLSTDQVRSKDTRTFDIAPELLSEWAQGDYPHQKHFDPKCPKWLWSSVVLRFGFGHKTGNWVTGLIGAQILRLRSVYNKFESSDDHANTQKDLARWLGFEIDEFFESDIPANATRVMLPSIPMAAKHLHTYGPAIDFLKGKTDCNVLYKIDEGITAPNEWGMAHPIIAQKYWKARLADPFPLTLFNSSEINIAIHVRVGDWVPTQPSWHYDVGIKLIQILRSNRPGCAQSALYQSIPIRFHVFSSDNSPVLEPLKQLPSVVFHNVDAKSTLAHLIECDIFIASSSGFSQVAYLAALKPIVITPPTRELKLPFLDCHHSSHLCLQHEVEFDMYQLARLHSWRLKWLHAKMPHLLSSI